MGVGGKLSPEVLLMRGCQVSLQLCWSLVPGLESRWQARQVGEQKWGRLGI